jgi:hypothetical protein
MTCQYDGTFLTGGSHDPTVFESKQKVYQHGGFILISLLQGIVLTTEMGQGIGRKTEKTTIVVKKGMTVIKANKKLNQSDGIFV